MNIQWSSFFCYFLIVSILGIAEEAQADFFHFNNFLVGDRAIGLGGAYVGVSDDASAIAYNPAGMSFALAPSFSGSANAFYNRRIIYKDTIGSDDFTEVSQGSVPSFFGGLQQIKSLGKGTAFGFSIYSTDNDFKSQNDIIAKPELGIKNFHRTINTQSATNYFGAGMATRLTSRVSLGFATNLVKIDELTQEYQDTTLNANANGLVLTEEGASHGALLLDITQNRKMSINVLAVEPVLGFQFVPLDTITVGVTLRQPFIFDQNLIQYVDLTRVNRFEDGTPLSSSDISEQSSEQWRTLKEKGVKLAKQTPGAASQGLALGKFEIEKPLGGLAGEARIGLAWFASSRILFTSDLSYRVAPAKGDLSSLNTEDVLNLHFGSEFYLTNSLPLRLGLFTNNDARKELDSSGINQQDHVDYYGGSVVITWASGGSQIGLGTVAQYGLGKSQKVAGDKRIQEVEAFFYSAVISTSYTM